MTERQTERSESPSGRRGDDGGQARGDGARPYCCDLCGALMFEFHCRLICTQCGFQRDCSDP